MRCSLFLFRRGPSRETRIRDTSRPHACGARGARACVAGETAHKRNCSMKNEFTSQVAVLTCRPIKTSRGGYLYEASIDTRGRAADRNRGFPVFQLGLRPE